MSGYRRVAGLADLPDGATLRIEAAGVAVCLARWHGEVFALGDSCSHAEVSLAEGDLDRAAVECWLHGSRFDLRSGAALSLPATAPVATYPVRVEGDDIYVAVEEN